MRRYSVLLAALMVLLLAAVPRLRALTDDEKKEQFVQARDDSDSTPTPHHKKHAEATPHRRHSPAPGPKETSLPDVTPHHKHSPTPEPDETSQPDVTPRHRHSATPEPDETSQPNVTPHRRHSPTPEPDETSQPNVTPHRRHSPTPEPDEISQPDVTPRHRHSPTPEPDETSQPDVTPHHRHSPTPETTPKHKHQHATDEAAETPARQHHHSPTPEPTPRKHAHPQEQVEETPLPIRHTETPSPTPWVTPLPQEHPSRTPAPHPSESYQQYEAATPFPMPRATPAPTPPPGVSGAQVNIEKEGLEQQGGFEPPPPTPVRHHWWQFFGGDEQPHTYYYLTRAVRDAIDRAPVARHRWRFIVVHNSGTRQGNAKIFDYYHRYVRKMPNGLAYQFVIGNGTSTGNGQIEVGNRWVRQIQGGHVHSDYLNNIALGICLVGDFNRDLPTKEQLAALDELIRYLRIRVGKIDGKPAIVKAHKEINPPQWPTDCPGDRFPYHWLHERYD